MSDDTTPQQPVDETPQPTEPHEYGTPAKQRVRDRFFGFRSMVAVGAAGVILGGAVGTTITLVADGGDHGDRSGMVGFRDDPAGFPGDRDGDGEHGDQHGPTGGAPGGMPPATPPDDGTQPDTSSDTTGGTNS